METVEKKEKKTWKYKDVHPRPKQIKLAQILVRNNKRQKPLNKGEMLEMAGYSKSVATYPERVITSKGVQKELNYLGFNTNNAKRVVAEILEKEEAKDENRLRAADMILDVHGEYKREKETPNTVNIAIFSTEQQERIAQRIIQMSGKALQSSTTHEKEKDDTSIK